jgi:hypothetical protein
MTTKELIIQELERIPEVELTQVLSYLKQLHPVEPPTQAAIDNEFLQTYAHVVEQRHEIFQRLADA